MNYLIQFYFLVIDKILYLRMVFEEQLNQTQIFQCYQQSYQYDFSLETFDQTTTEDYLGEGMTKSCKKAIQRD